MILLIGLITTLVLFGVTFGLALMLEKVILAKMEKDVAKILKKCHEKWLENSRESRKIKEVFVTEENYVDKEVEKYLGEYVE